MPYHVEVRRSRHHARLFNLEEAELQQRVLRPWQLGGPLMIGDQRWERRESELRILEGPRLSGSDLAYGQGWNRAERSAEDVTKALLESGSAKSVAVLASSGQTAQVAHAAIEQLGLRGVAWADVRARIQAWLVQPDALPELGVAAVLVIGNEAASGEWMFDAGLARGALGTRTVFAHTGQPPDALGAQDWVRLGDGGAAALVALAERLRQAGCATRGEVIVAVPGGANRARRASAPPPRRSSRVTRR